MEHKKFSQPPSAEALASYLKRNFPGGNWLSVYEAGFCGFHVHAELEKQGIRNMVVNAADVPTTHKEKENKTDKRDSRKLARSLRGGILEAIHVPLRSTQEERSLIRTRYTVRKDLSRMKVRIKALLNFYGTVHPEHFASPNSHWSKRYMRWLAGVPMETASGESTLKILIREVEEMRRVQLAVNLKIRELSRTPAYVENFRLISSIPGIALITGMSFLCEMEIVTRFGDTDHLASYVGLIPSCHDSGEEKSRGEITSRAHKLLRDMIVESAWTAARRDPALQMAFSRLCERMPPHSAIIRIARKVLNRIYYVLKTKKEYVCGVVE
jgi:transposase